MFHLARADAEGERGERAMCGRMRIAADHRHAGQGQALFRSDYMDNPLPLVETVKETHPELGTIFFQRFHLRAGDGVGNAAFRVQRRHIMIRHRLN